MKKIAIKIIALVPSEFQQGFYTLLLQEVDGKRQLPIIIGAIEARAIAQSVHKDSNEYNTFDLFPILLNQVKVHIKELVIKEVQDGNFLNQLSGIKADGNQFVLPVRVGEGIAIAHRLDCPIYVNEKVMEKVGVLIEESGKVLPLKNQSLEEHSIEELQTMLDDLIAEEDYRKACKVRDLIREKEKKMKRA